MIDIVEHEFIHPGCIATSVLGQLHQSKAIRFNSQILAYLVKPEIPEYVPSLMRDIEGPVVHAKRASLAGMHSTQVAHETATVEQ